MSNSSTYDPREREIGTPSWKIETRVSSVAEPESEVMPRITKPELLFDWFWTRKPGVKADSSSNALTPMASRNLPE